MNTIILTKKNLCCEITIEGKRSLDIQVQKGWAIINLYRKNNDCDSLIVFGDSSLKLELFFYNTLELLSNDATINYKLFTQGNFERKMARKNKPRVFPLPDNHDRVSINLNKRNFYQDKIPILNNNCFEMAVRKGYAIINLDSRSNDSGDNCAFNVFEGSRFKTYLIGYSTIELLSDNANLDYKLSSVPFNSLKTFSKEYEDYLSR